MSRRNYKLYNEAYDLAYHLIEDKHNKPFIFSIKKEKEKLVFQTNTRWEVKSSINLCCISKMHSEREHMRTVNYSQILMGNF